MKTCLICQSKCADDVATCPHDGEASWAWSYEKVVPASPISDEAMLHLAKSEIDLGVIIPTMAGVHGEMRDAKITPGGATAASDEPPTPPKPTQVKHWQQPKKQR